jgi:hypothetical protein
LCPKPGKVNSSSLNSSFSWRKRGTRRPSSRADKWADLSVETADVESAVGIGDPIEQHALGDARADPYLGQHHKQPFQILFEPAGMLGTQHVDREGPTEFANIV